MMPDEPKRDLKHPTFIIFIVYYIISYFLPFHSMSEKQYHPLRKECNRININSPKIPSQIPPNERVNRVTIVTRALCTCISLTIPRVFAQPRIVCNKRFHLAAIRDLLHFKPPPPEEGYPRGSCLSKENLLGSLRVDDYEIQCFPAWKIRAEKCNARLSFYAISTEGLDYTWEESGIQQSPLDVRNCERVLT